MTNEKKEAEEISITVDEKNCPIWKDEKGNAISGLKREHFINEEAKKIDSKHCWKQFYLYMVEFKKARTAAFQEKTDSLAAEIVAYQEKADNVGKTLSKEDQDKAKLASLEKKIAALKAGMAEG